MLALIGWHEFYTMLQKREIKVCFYLGLMAILFLVGCAWLGNSQEMVAVVFVFAVLILMKTVIFHRKFSINDASFTLLGTVYIGMSFVYLLLLRFIDSTVYFTTFWGLLPAGAVYVWLAFIGTWASDIFAFLIGSQFGKHKLSSTISPGKTIEGSIGGLIGSIIAVMALGTVFHISLIHVAAIGTLVGIMAPFGDLVESALKRFAGVKDSGKLLPGHGGVLDRFDSIMFAAPTVYYYVHIFVLR
jgi:phosphatidate cytidylyltransferase